MLTTIDRYNVFVNLGTCKLCFSAVCVRGPPQDSVEKAKLSFVVGSFICMSLKESTQKGRQRVKIH